MASSRKLVLLDDVDTDVAGDTVKWYSLGPGTLHIFATDGDADWDGATVTLSGSVDGTNFDDVAD